MLISADIGGQFNLFAGFSILTYFELVEYVVIKLWRCSRVTRHKKDSKVFVGVGGQEMSLDYLDKADEIRKEKFAPGFKAALITKLASIVESNLNEGNRELGIVENTGQVSNLAKRTLSVSSQLQPTESPFRRIVSKRNYQFS